MNFGEVFEELVTGAQCTHLVTDGELVGAHCAGMVRATAMTMHAYGFASSIEEAHERAIGTVLDYIKHPGVIAEMRDVVHAALTELPANADPLAEERCPECHSVGYHETDCSRRAGR